MEKSVEDLLEVALVTEEAQPYIIPENWVWTRVQQISAYIQRGKGPKYSEIEEIPVISQKCVQWAGFDISRARFIDPETISGYNKERLLQTNDLLWNSTGTGTIGRINIYPGDDRYKYVVADSHVTIIRISSSFVSPKFILFWLSSPSVQGEIEKLASGSTNQIELNTTSVKSQIVPLPPLKEQLRIVNAIESLFDKLDKAKELISEVREEFEHRKAAILAEAFRGKLTAKWREENPQVESTEKILEQIYIEKGKIKHKISKDIDETLVPPSFDIPNNWRWVRLFDVCSHIEDIDHKMPKAVETGIKFISAKDLLDNGTINFEKDIKYISEEDYTRLSRKIAPQRGDIIYSRIGARLGKARLVECDEKFIASYSCCTIRAVGVNNKYLNYYLDSGEVLKQAKENIKSVGVPDLGMSKIRGFWIPLPPRKEQNSICTILDKLIIEEAKVEELTQLEDQIETMKKAILVKAFRGELGTNDPSEESAIEQRKQVLEEKAG